MAPPTRFSSRHASNTNKFDASTAENKSTGRLSSKKRASSANPLVESKKQKTLDSYFGGGKTKKTTSNNNNAAVAAAPKADSSHRKQVVPAAKKVSTSPDTSAPDTRKQNSNNNRNTNIPKYRYMKTPYTAGDHLAVITEPQAMFDDMVECLRRTSSNDSNRLAPLVQKLRHRRLRIATMCSGTESPLLALDMLQKSIRDACRDHPELLGTTTECGEDEIATIFQLEHCFSCEIEPYKQAYIERNFHPPLLFRDIRELGQDQAYTAYGALHPVPHENVDILVAGTSCVDYSNLNNAKKNMEEQGESGSTFYGMMNWIKKASPLIVLIENVFGAPWDKKVELFAKLGYSAAYLKLDTKDFYIPHTRQRGYLFAIKQPSTRKGTKLDSRPETWKTLVGQLKRPASASVDAFVLRDDDPRVLRGRARLTAESSVGENGTRAGRTDWTKCETRHLAARSVEELGDQRPLTGWSDSGHTALPGHCWNEWANAQVNRIHDLLDINTLRLATDGVDALWKTMIWNLSQNVDRDTMGRLGLCQCLTPTGVPYLTSRGGPLCGEELLMLQGIPADDLLLTKESEDNLKDLAGNAMSTTVVGACMLAALLVGHASLLDDDDDGEGSNSMFKIVPSLVPRALVPISKEISVSSEFGTYKQSIVDLLARDLPDEAAWKAFLAEAASSARKCVSEGVEECIPPERLVQCRACGQTSSVANAFPPRKFCEHDYAAMAAGRRVEPSAFRTKLLQVLPMRVMTDGFDADALEEPKDVDSKLWNQWVAAFRRTVADEESGVASEFLLEEVKRTHIWTAFYRSPSGGRLEASISNQGVTWFLFANAPNKTSALKTRLENPVARMTVSPSSSGFISLLGGSWEYCLPVMPTVTVSIEGIGSLVPSWCSRLGLKGGFESERQNEALRIQINDPNHVALQKIVNGTYKLLPKCGGACGSLMKKACERSDSPSVGNAVFFFLDSGLKTLPKDDAFIFAPSFHRTAQGEFREIVLQIDPEKQYRPVIKADRFNGSGKVEVQAIIPGLWVLAPNASLKPLSNSTCSEMTIKCPVTPLSVPIHRDAWKVCPELISCTVKVPPTEDLFVRCHKAGGEVELNLQKSKKTLASLTFALSRLEIPILFHNNRWLDLDQTRFAVSDEDAVCHKCAPTPPQVRWTLVAKGNRAKFIPIEDGREAAVFERALKERPKPWIVRFNISNDNSPTLSMTIGCNAVSLVQRAFGLLPANSFVRQCMVSLAESINGDRMPSCLCEFGWRVVSHVEMVAASFPKLTFSSNRHDTESEQPPNFIKYKLRKEQLRSLTWMKEQEASIEPFYEEEIAESVLPNLNWRMEGRARRPVLVRGGIIADEVGYGKTACALALIDSSKPLENLALQEHRVHGLLPTKATLVVVPKHLMGQWPEEVKKFLCTSKTVIVIKDLSSLNKISVDNVQNADIVIVSFAVLSNDQYFSRLARLTHINARSLSGANGGRHFDAVYSEMLCELPMRVKEIIKDFKSAHKAIEKAASSHKQNTAGTVRLDGKKAVYKMGVSASQISAASSDTKLTQAETDPWKFSSAKKYVDMKSPPLEMFSWNRLVVDEFTYLSKKDRERCLTVIKELKSTFRWLLSGTPKHSNFNDISSLARLLGVHLGVEEDLPGTKISNKYLNDKESTGLESLSSFLESRSMQWHMRRHSLAQSFLDRFVRQNIAELDEIPFDDQKCPVVLPPAERAIYLELEAHLKSLEMNSKSAQKSRSKSTGDRESRMQKILQNSETGEEALLKCCSQFNMTSGLHNALETVDSIIALRASEKENCEQEMVSMLTAALRQRQRILECHPDWLSVTTTEKGEVRDALGVYLGQVEANASVPHGADQEVNTRVNELVQEAVDCFQAAPGTDTCCPFFSNDDEGSEIDPCDTEAKRKKQKRQNKKPTKEVDAIRLFAMKQALRNHMHVVRSISKELCGRYRSLRYIQQIRRYQQEAMGFECVVCKNSHLPIQDVGVLSCCGHAGCEKDLRSAAAEGRCIDPLCTARVSVSHVLLAKDFGGLNQETVTGQFGRKLSALTGKVQELVDNQGDRVVVFCQFDDLSEKVKEALTSSGIKSVQVKGTVTQQISTISIFQKEIPAKGDPRVLLLKMDDEQSAGLNLTNLNHAIFVHPLLADTQVEYDAYETQAIGRLRRYGQKKTVYVWRFLAEDTIDTEIFSQRSSCHVPITELMANRE